MVCAVVPARERTLVVGSPHESGLRVMVVGSPHESGLRMMVVGSPHESGLRVVVVGSPHESGLRVVVVGSTHESRLRVMVAGSTHEGGLKVMVVGSPHEGGLRVMVVGSPHESRLRVMVVGSPHEGGLRVMVAGSPHKSGLRVMVAHCSRIENDGSVRSFQIHQAALFRDAPPAPIRGRPNKTRSKKVRSTNPGWHTAVRGTLLYVIEKHRKAETYHWKLECTNISGLEHWQSTNTYCIDCIGARSLQHSCIVRNVTRRCKKRHLRCRFCC